MSGHSAICPKCGRELNGISIVFGKKWACSKCVDDKTDPLHCELGCRVEFAHPNRGLEHEREEAGKLLKTGVAYEIEKVDVGSYSSKIELKEFPGIKFNSVFFDRVL